MTEKQPETLKVFEEFLPQYLTDLHRYFQIPYDKICLSFVGEDERNKVTIEGKKITVEINIEDIGNQCRSLNPNADTKTFWFNLFASVLFATTVAITKDPEKSRTFVDYWVNKMPPNYVV